MTTAVQAAPADGTWTWSAPARGDRPERISTLTLKTEGDKVTGTISGRQNQEGIKISEGKVTGEDISFNVSAERGGNTFVQKYTGKVSGDSIKGKIAFTTRNGEERTRDWEAKRKKE